MWTVTEGPGAISGLLEGPDTGSDRIAVSDDGEALFEVAPGDIETEGPLATITVEAHLREQDEACAYPPSGELIGEGKVGLLGTSEPYEDPCTDGAQTFNFGYWNHLLITPSYSISGEVGGIVTVTVDVPKVDLETESDYREVDIVIPRPMGHRRDDVTVSGANFQLGNVSDAGGWIVQVRSDDDGDAPVKHVQLGLDAVHISLRAFGPITVSVPTMGYPGGCSRWGACCPYIGRIETQDRRALMGPLVYIRLHASVKEGIRGSSVVDRVDVSDN